MKTRLIISNISYNTEAFLKGVLDSLVSEGYIKFYMYIFHKAEDDELKDHFHIILYPDGTLDTNQIYPKFIQPDIDDEYPLCVTRMWQTVAKDKDLEWILYVLHDKLYCRLKCGYEKKYTYLSDDLKSSDRFALSNLLYRAYHETDIYHDMEIIKKIKDEHFQTKKLIENGFISIKQAPAYHHFIQLLKNQ